MLQRDEGLGGGDTRDLLYSVVEKAHKVLVVVGVELDEHGVVAGGEVALYYLGDAAQALHNIVVHAASLQIDAYIGAGGVTHALGIDPVAGA